MHNRLFAGVAGYKLVRMHDSVAYQGCTLYFFRLKHQWKQYVINKENGIILAVSSGTTF